MNVIDLEVYLIALESFAAEPAGLRVQEYGVSAKDVEFFLVVTSGSIYIFPWPWRLLSVKPCRGIIL